MSELSDHYSIVVAIDIGTTYSGYVFSSVSNFHSDPLHIYTPMWNRQQGLSLKTPTCLLLDKNKKFIAFGYEAEDLYLEKVLEGEQNLYYFFQRFKMQLYRTEHITKLMEIHDVTEKPLRARMVFTKLIKALMEHSFDNINQRYVYIKKEDIRWVLTVPAIWTDAAKQFMRKSANLAGIKNEQLLISIEPEAASIYAQYLSTGLRQIGLKKQVMLCKAGTQYMVVDMGGGTVDITIHEKMTSGELKELCQASGGDCGGTSADMGFYQMFVKLVGAPLMNEMKKKEPCDYLDIFREFEAAKRKDLTQTKTVRMAFPRGRLDEMCQRHLGEDFTAAVEQSPYKDQIKVRNKTMLIDAEIIIKLFRDASGRIIELMKQALTSKNVKRECVIVLVGGFSECTIIQNEIKSHFPDSIVVTPEEPIFAVLKGAVLFGHRPNYIISRISRYTYGVRYNPPFDPKTHELKRKFLNEAGEERCKGVFNIFVKTGEEVELGTLIRKEFTSKPFVTFTDFAIFRSTTENPLYTDADDCELIGKVTIHFPQSPKQGKDIRFEMFFGHTELAVAAYDDLSGQKCEAMFELE